MWYPPVKSGGDSGAVQQVSDIGGGFGRVSFTARSRRCHGIDVKREIIAAAPPRRCARGDANVCAAGALLRAVTMDLCVACAFLPLVRLTGLTRSERPVLLDSSARQQSPRGSPSSVFRLGLQIRTSGTALSLPAAGLD